MKKSSRDILKNTFGITESDDKKKKCKKCNYHDRYKICQIHKLKTKDTEICIRYKPKSKISVFQGGSTSSR